MQFRGWLARDRMLACGIACRRGCPSNLPSRHRLEIASSRSVSASNWECRALDAVHSFRSTVESRTSTRCPGHLSSFATASRFARAVCSPVTLTNSCTSATRDLGSWPPILFQTEMLWRNWLASGNGCYWTLRPASFSRCHLFFRPSPLVSRATTP